MKIESVRYATDKPGAMAPPDGGPRIRSFAELRGHLREDLAVSEGLLSPGFHAVATYRFGVWTRGIHPRPLRVPGRLIYRMLRLVARNFYGIELSDHTRVGRRLRIAHQHGIVVHRRAVLGDDCLLRHGVTIGAVGGRAGRSGAPRLGNRVEVGVGAVLVGPISVGDDALIGPNAVVMTNVPPSALVSSPQSRVVAPPPRRGTSTPRPRGETPSPGRETSSAEAGARHEA